jgi:hypothetical protein
LFVDIANQLAEFENKDFEEHPELSGDHSQRRKEAEAPFLEASLRNHTISLKYKNQTKVWLELFVVDLEILFSEDPFEKKTRLWTTTVMPSKELTFNLQQSENLQTEELEIPEEWRLMNLLVRVRDDNSQSVFLKYLPFHLDYSVHTSQAMVKLTHPKTSDPVPKVYAKCYAKLQSGKVAFVRDGYTDLRGSFRYVFDLAQGDVVVGYSILVISSEFGAKIIRVDAKSIMPIKRKGAKKILSSNWRNLGSQNAGKGLYSQAMIEADF